MDWKTQPFFIERMASPNAKENAPIQKLPFSF
jgi:hypothetical protein